MHRPARLVPRNWMIMRSWNLRPAWLAARNVDRRSRFRAQLRVELPSSIGIRFAASISPGWWGGAGQAQLWMLRILERAYWFVTFTGSAIIFVFGGFVPVGRRWLLNEIGGWADVVATFGGVWFSVVTHDPDSDLGPVVARVDAPLLFSTIDTVGRRLGVKPPGQVRLTYLPCCGVVAWGRSRALLIGLPLFRVLTQGELRSRSLRAELAHLAQGRRDTCCGRPAPSKAWSGQSRNGGRHALGSSRRLGAVLLARGLAADRASVARPGGPRRPVRRRDCRRQRSLIGPGQSGSRSAALPRGLECVRPKRARLVKPLRVFPLVLVPAAG